MYRYEYHKYKGKERKEMHTRYKFPDWISYMALDCHAHHTVSGWQVTLQSFRFMDASSSFFEAVRLNHVSSVRKMLLSHEAFVTDRVSRSESMKGATALHVRHISPDPSPGISTGLMCFSLHL
jgi:hypothetical protein